MSSRRPGYTRDRIVDMATEKDLRFSHERRGSTTAVIQALRFHFGMRPSKIERMMGLCANYVYRVTCEGSDVMAWDRRRYQAEAIAEAEQLIQASK